MADTEGSLAGRQACSKAGGMRIKAARHVEEKKPSVEEEEASSELQVKEEGTEVAVTSANPQHHTEFNKEETKNMQQKHSPTHEKPVMNKQINKMIQQPR